MLVAIKSPPRMEGIATHAKSVAKVMAVTSTPRPGRRSRPLHHHPFVDNIASKCYDVKRGTKAGGKVKKDMDSHNTSTQYST
jgi:hypothetical protein